MSGSAIVLAFVLSSHCLVDKERLGIATVALTLCLGVYDWLLESFKLEHYFFQHVQRLLARETIALRNSVIVYTILQF
jgi:hypothetical protein